MAVKTLTEQVNEVIASLQADIKNNTLDIPSPPDLLVKVRRLTASPNSTAQQLADLVKHDINLSGRLIKVANSALFGFRHQATSAHSAIARLGQNRVQSLVIGLLVGQRLIESKTVGLEDFCRKAWQDSNNVAAISYVLASVKSDLDPEHALLAGMVHNVGVLPLLLKLNKVDSLKSNPRVMSLVAEAVIPKLYQSAGKLILKSWNFPDDIIEVTKSHRNYDSPVSSDITLSDIVFIAYHLNQLKVADGEIEFSDSFITSIPFKKLWHSQEEALKDFDDIKDKIKQVKYDITN
jgi:HD-like signal output (HDOD) protein